MTTSTVRKTNTEQIVHKNKYALHCKSESRTQQQFAESANIKNIVDRIKRGVMPIGQTRPPLNIDHTQVKPYHEALNLVTEIKQNFLKQPAKIRERFQNDPAKMLEFLEDPKNMAQAIDLGLATPTEEAKEAPITKVEVVNPSAPAEKASGGSKT